MATTQQNEQVEDEVLQKKHGVQEPQVEQVLQHRSKSKWNVRPCRSNGS